MIQALLTASLIWAAGLLTYGLLLRPVAAHGFRRAYLLAVAGAGAIVPWIPVPRPEVAFLPAAPQLDRVWLEDAVVTAVGQAPSNAPGAHPLALAYGLGLAIAIGFVAYGIWRLVRCFGESRPLDTEDVGMDIRETHLAEGPFSFGRTLFVPDWRGLTLRERATLLRHERAHYRLGHRFDNVAMAALCTVAYFHPLAHLLRRELRLVHEYQADQATLADTDLGAYRRQLLAQQLTTSPSLLAAAFAQRPLESRFNMMTRKFHPRQAWRLATAALLLTATTVACTKDGVDEEQLAELERVQAEAVSAEDQVMSLEEALATKGYTMTTDTIEIFDPETGTSERQYVGHIVDRDGNPVKDFTVTEENDRVRETRQLVRNQEVLRIVEEMPYFKGGGCADSERACHEKAMLQHIYSQIKYPEAVRDAGVEGKVLVQFVVGTDGAILEPEIIRSPHEALSEEVLRIMREMPEWAPGRKDGEAVQVSFVLPVQFLLS